MNRTPTPFCPGVEANGTPPAAVPATPSSPPGAQFQCYASNPPTSGRHLNVWRGADLGNGIVINIPPDFGVYPPELEIPREAIPHILEHAGVFVGYNCARDDGGCEDTASELAQIVRDRIDNHHDRVVMAHDNDLPSGEIALASWTRLDRFNVRDFTDDRVVTFISINSCRYDPEGFCL